MHSYNSLSSEHLRKIGNVAHLLGDTPQTLRNWTNNGYMDAVIGMGGHGRFRRSEVEERIMELNEREDGIKKCLLYCRVSTSIQKENLERQIERLTSFALSNGFIIERMYKDIASGMNFKRRGLLKLLDHCQKHRIPTVIVSALDLLERKCIKRGVAIKKMHPAFTSLIGKYTYLRLYNLSTHVLASYIIARKGLGFKEPVPPLYKWVLARVGDAIKPRLKPSSPYRDWAKLHDFFKHSGITSFKTAEVMKKTLQMKHVLNPVTGAQPDNLRAGLSSNGTINHWNKVWNFIEIPKFL